MSENLKTAIFSAVLTATLTIPIFGLQLVRQGAQTHIVPNWEFVLMGIAAVFVVQLFRPYLFKSFAKNKRGSGWAMPVLKPRTINLLILLVVTAAAIWPFFSSRSNVDIATLVLIYVMLGLGLNCCGFCGFTRSGLCGLLCGWCLYLRFIIPLGWLGLLVRFTRCRWHGCLVRLFTRFPSTEIKGRLFSHCDLRFW